MSQPQLLTVRLNRSDSSTPWGFRLQGGKDFGTPLLIQKVNMGSVAERSGLQVGDAVVRVNGQELYDQRHKDAQDAIVRGGNNIEISIQRGGHNTWKPLVTPVGTTPSPNPYISSAPSPVTKTSLAATNKRPSPTIGSGYNSVSKPYSPQMNGGYVNDSGSIKAIVNKQYNTPVGIYSDESIAETLSAQAEVLAGGVLGVNFKKNEKNYDSQKSEVFKMVQEVEKEPKSPEPDVHFNNDSGVIVPPPVSGLRHVSAPQAKSPGTNSTLSPGQNICADCERLIVGVFVRIKDKNLHVECFKCATCGTSLKNVGYYSINNKLYCDIHAKMIARQNPPAPNLDPVIIPPTSQFGPSKMLSSPKASSLSPVPFHAPRQVPTHVPASFTQPQYNSNNIGKSPPPMNNNFSCTFSAPKPVGNPYKEQVSNTTTSFQSYYDPNHRPLPFLKPRSDKVSAFMPVMKSEIRHGRIEAHNESVIDYNLENMECSSKSKDLKLETVFESCDYKYDGNEDLKTKKDNPSCNEKNSNPNKRASICSQEVSNVLSESGTTQTLSSTLDTQMLMTVIKETDHRPQSPVPSNDGHDFTSAESHKSVCFRDEQCMSEASFEVECISARPHSVRSLSPAICERPLTPNQIVVFPPEIPSILPVKTRSRISTPQSAMYSNVGTVYDLQSQSYSGANQQCESQLDSEKFRNTHQIDKLNEEKSKYLLDQHSNTYSAESRLCSFTQPSVSNKHSNTSTAESESSSFPQQMGLNQFSNICNPSSELCSFAQQSGSNQHPNTCTVGSVSFSFGQQIGSNQCSNTCNLESESCLFTQQSGSKTCSNMFSGGSESRLSSHQMGSNQSSNIRNLESESCSFTQQPGSKTCSNMFAGGSESRLSSHQMGSNQSSNPRNLELQSCSFTQQSRPTPCSNTYTDGSETHPFSQHMGSNQSSNVCNPKSESCSYDQLSGSNQCSNIYPVESELCLFAQQSGSSQHQMPQVSSLELSSQSLKSSSPIFIQYYKTQELTHQNVLPNYSCKESKFESEPLINFEDCSEITKICNKGCSDVCCCVIERTRETIRICSPVPMMQKSELRITELIENELCEDEKNDFKDLPEIREKPGFIASAVTVAPDRPFTPVEPIVPLYLQKPIPLPPETIPYIPGTHVAHSKSNPAMQAADLKSNPATHAGNFKSDPAPNQDNSKNDTKNHRPISPFVEALTIASNRSYSPLPTVHKPFPEKSEDKVDLIPENRLTMAQALATAPKKSYYLSASKIPPAVITPETEANYKKTGDSKVPGTKLPPLDDPSVILKESPRSNQNLKSINKPIEYKQGCTITSHEISSSLFSENQQRNTSFPSISMELKAMFEAKAYSHSGFKKTDKIVENIEQQTDVRQEIYPEKRTSTPKHPYTPTGLHKPSTIPHYQKCVEELTAKNKTPGTSRLNTPTPTSRKSTPISFQPKTQTECKILRTESSQEIKSSSLKSSATCFLSESTNITEKITPALGYQPNPLAGSDREKKVQSSKIHESKSERKTQNPFATVGIDKKLNPSVPFFSGSAENIHAFGSMTEKSIDKNEKTHKITEKTDIEIQSSQISSQNHTVNKISVSSLRSLTSTPDHTIKSSPLADTPSSTAPPITVTPSGNQYFKPPPVSPITTKNLSHVAAQLSLNLCKLSTSPNRQFSSTPVSNTCAKKPACMPSKPISSSDPKKPTGGADGIGFKSGTSAGLSAPRRGRGILNPQNISPGARIPLCAQCNSQIRGPFVTAIGKIWCPEHFICVNQKCRRSLMDIGFVEEPSGLYCEYCFEQYLAPTCSKCSKKVKGDCLNAIGKHFHPECFTCAYCGKLFGNSPFFLEDGLPYCENDWNELFTTKCFACGFPIEAGDRWVEALNNNYHSPCFNCTMCKTNLEGQSFYAKGGRPYCKNHAR